ncbi:DUF5406 family protein, partial [Escherichia coli]|uniref:DUF5406 family protein n=1 Tax=Escherichia coli TaxID=562 RepID=UPI001FCEBFAA
MNNQNTQPQIMNYDPNLTSCGRMAKQTVRLTFGLWEYRETGNDSNLLIVFYVQIMPDDFV